MSKVVTTFLTAEAFDKAPDLKLEDVPLPEFGEGAGVRIVELDAESAQRFGELVAKEDDKFAGALWVIASARRVNADGSNGEPVFTDSPQTRAKILALGASIVMRLSNTALKLNGFTKDETDKETKN